MRVLVVLGPGFLVVSGWCHPPSSVASAISCCVLAFVTWVRCLLFGFTFIDVYRIPSIVSIGAGTSRCC